MKNSNHKENTTGGFTLIELLVVIGIIGILAGIVIVAINPSRQFAQARNTTREAAVSTLLNAIGQNVADNKGIFNRDGDADGDTTGPEDCGSIGPVDQIGTGGTETDLSCLSPRYIPTGIPTDPDGGSSTNTLYTVAVDSLGRYTVCAPKHGTEASLPDVDTYCLTR